MHKKRLAFSNTWTDRQKRRMDFKHLPNELIVGRSSPTPHLKDGNAVVFGEQNLIIFICSHVIIMGGRGSKAVKRITSVLTGATDDVAPDERNIVKYGASPFIFSRRGSMFIDEDGDIAHEFYEEVQCSENQKCRLRRMVDNLIPQGEIDHPIPRLNPNIPYIICEN
ncbi:Tumor suppressor candidate 2 [Chamberlinius hualienensis]